MSSDERVWVVPPALRPALSRRYGIVLAGPAVEERIRGLKQFASCGDRVTALAIQTGNLPLVGIVDYKTQREEPVDPQSFEPLRARRLVRVRNPAGTLTEGLRTAVRELIRTGGGLVEVDGEEDLGSLALVEAMPSGATVIYGLPGEGVSFVPVDVVTQNHVRELIAQMELRMVRHGS